MKKTYLDNLFIGVFLFVAVFASITVFGLAIRAQKSNQTQLGLPATGGQGYRRPTAGMGNLHRFEAQQAWRMIGMGDLHRFEAQQARIDATAQECSNLYAGMGNLHRFEAQQSLGNWADRESRRFYAGMGDLHRLEAQQEQARTGRGCPLS